MVSSRDCVFCGIVTGDEPAEVVDRDAHTVTFMDINPATSGHCLVVPRRHVRDLWTCEPHLAGTLMEATCRAAVRIRTALRPHGLNVWQSSGTVASQTVFHLHLHVIPRYPGDGVRLPWTKRPGDPPAIRKTADRIRSA